MNRNLSDHERIPGLDLVRFAACLGIVLYHFSAGSNCALFKRLFLNYANGSWGNALVALFLMLSGALLHRHYCTKLDVPKFYLRRFEAIYPEFWLAFACCFALRAIRAGSLFYKGHPALLLLSFLGMDGYFLYRIPNYYILGEWFLGAIILIYLLYPALRRLFLRVPLTLTGTLLALCMVIDKTHLFQIAINRNLAVCIFEFVLGMLLMKYHATLQRPVWTYICLFIEVILLCFALPRPYFSQTYSILHAFALYVLLGRLGNWIASRFDRTYQFILSGASISYPIYLMHNFILHNILDIRNPSNPLGASVVLLATILLTCVTASLLHFIIRHLLRSIKRS